MGFFFFFQLFIIWNEYGIDCAALCDASDDVVLLHYELIVLLCVMRDA